MTDLENLMGNKDSFKEATQVIDPKLMDLLRNGLADKEDIQDVLRAINYGDRAMYNPKMRNNLYKTFRRLLATVKDDSQARQLVKRDLNKPQPGVPAMSENNNLDVANVTKAIAHDCAKHVVHEQWGRGQCIPEEHTLDNDGTVSHYDVMFDHGVEQDVPATKLEILMSEMHGHMKKKKMMETVAGDTLKANPSTPDKIADITPQEGGGEDTSKASKKGKLEMPMEKLKAIMEKRKSPAYLAMLKSQGKMEEQADQVDEDRDLSVRTLYNKFADAHVGGKDTKPFEKAIIKVHGNNVFAHMKKAAEAKAAGDKDGEAFHFDVAGEAASANIDGWDSSNRVGGVYGSGRSAFNKDRREEVEQIGEKMLTSAEMKKREEVAKAIERDQPGMPMGKKMAIATATAKKVAEALVGDQHKIDANNNGKVDSNDFKLLKAKKTMKEFVEQLSTKLK